MELLTIIIYLSWSAIYVTNYSDVWYYCGFHTMTVTNLAYTVTDGVGVRVCNGYLYIRRSYYSLMVLIG